MKTSFKKKMQAKKSKKLDKEFYWVNAIQDNVLWYRSPTKFKWFDNVDISEWEGETRTKRVLLPSTYREGDDTSCFISPNEIKECCLRRVGSVEFIFCVSKDRETVKRFTKNAESFLRYNFFIGGRHENMVLLKGTLEDMLRDNIDIVIKFPGLENWIKIYFDK